MADAERVLVTGASGYIASHVIKQLQEAGYKVRGSVRSLKDENKIKHIKGLCEDAAHEVELVEAELQNAESWKSAAEGCTYVIHCASPFPLSVPKQENTLIQPAVEGVKNVLQAAVDNKVKRVVMTSAGLAVSGSLRDGEFAEKDWPEDVDSLGAYPKSKTLAEKAAWDFVKELKEEDHKIELAVINPVGVVGPVLNSTLGTSAEISKRLLTRNPMMVVKISLPLIDVRDVAEAHVKALTLPEVVGNRHILCAGNVWWADMAAILAKEFKPQGYNVPSMMAPKVAVKMASWFDRDSKAILPNWNKVSKFDNTRMKEVLKIEPRDLTESIIEMGYSVIERGFVKKSKKYKGPGGVAAAAEAAAAAEEEGAKGEGEAAADVTANGVAAENGTEEGAETKTDAEEEKAADETKADENKEETPKEETPKEETPKEETPKEETPKEESPKEESPKEESPKEESPKEESPKEESPKEESPKEESPKEETPKEDSPNEETPNEESPKEEETPKENGVAENGVAENGVAENGVAEDEVAENGVNEEEERAPKAEEPVTAASLKAEAATTNGDAPSEEAVQA